MTTADEGRAGGGRGVAATTAVGGCLVGAATAFAFAPLVVAEDYDWVRNSISESAAQGVEGAWLARSGFLLFGLAVWLVAQQGVGRRPKPAIVALRVVAAGLVVVAAFSARPWRRDVEFDRVEDTLHAVGASTIGVAITIAALVMALAVPDRAASARGGDAVMVLASVGLPVAMTAWSGAAGLLQRLMFAVALLWFAADARRR